MKVELLLQELVQNNVKLTVKEDKLLCQLPAGGIDDSLLVLLKQHRDEIKEIIQTMRKSRLTRPSIQKRKDASSPGVLSYMQQRLWVLDQLEGSAHYNISNALLLEGELDADILQKVFNSIIERHEIIRTVYAVDENGEPAQIVQSVQPLPILKVDLTDFSEEEQQKKVRQLQAEDSKLSFDLKKDILLRVTLIQLKQDAFVLFVTMHHIATDGWSFGILMKEFSTLYRAYSKAEKDPLPELAIQYSDYAEWQQEWLKGETLEELKSFWSGQLQDLPPVHSLPLDNARPKAQTFTGNTIHSKIDVETLSELKRICDKEGATLFAGLYAAFSVLLGRYSNEKDIVVGTPIANREQSEVEDLIGFFVNMLVLRTRLSDEQSFVELVRQNKQLLLDVYAHQQMPFDMLVSTIQPERNPAYSSLFQVMIVLQNNERTEIKLPGLSIRQVEKARPFAMYDLSLTINENENGLLLNWEYNTDIFRTLTIKRMAVHFERLLKSLIASPEADVNKAGILSDEEMEGLAAFNRTGQPYPQDRTIMDLFAEQVRATPEHIAVKFEERSYTYAQLDQMSNQLAGYLAGTYAIGANDLAGIKLERSESLSLAILSVLKAGAAYVPIGADYPEERVDYIIKDAKIKVLINEEELSRFFQVQNNYPKERLAVKPSPGDLAYCIYTSGSTGAPKGVLNQHDGLYNRLVWMKEYLNVTGSDVILQKTPYTFDVSVWELLLPFICGAQLVFAIPDGHKDPFYLQQLIDKEQVTITHFVPSMLNVFLASLEPAACKSLNHIVCSGEALPAKVVSECKQKLNSRIHNFYGPTEAAIDVTAIDLTNVDTEMHGVTIGSPIANTSIYIVNEAMGLQPVGIPGELLIGGVQVARGYLNKPQLSSEKFISDPFREGSRVYRTGDIAKWNPDGSITYLCRKDDQVKIRGHRIELGEVTAHLLSKPSIKDAVVTVHKISEIEKELVAYIVSDVEEDASSLRKFLAGKIPDFEIPAFFIQLEALPLSPNGKVDQKALPDPAIGTLTGNVVYEAPRNEQEEKLIEIFARGLGRNPSEIGVHDNFFDLGANSIKLIKIMNEIKKEFKVEMRPVLLFQYPNINELVSMFASNQNEATTEEEAFISADMDDMLDSFY
jgi:amino acid adenylation domain-containing protein